MSTRGIAAYLRVSTLSQVERGEGLEIQEKRITEHCREKNLSVDKFYRDEGISGAVKDRPGLLSLLKDCEDGKIGKVVVYKQDRLSRELTISLWLETQFKKHDIEVISVIDPEYDLEDPLQKAFKRIADVFAELEKDVIAVRLREGRINRARNGKRGSGAVAFGYRKTGDTITIDPEEAVWVNKMFRMAAKGVSFSKIRALLDKNGVNTKRGKGFQIESIRYVLKNSLYCGEANFGDMAVKGVHEPIISRRLFRKVQRRFAVL